MVHGMSKVKRYRAGDFVPVASVAASDFDAQRLRADTAEAERDSWKSRCARRVDDIGLIAGRLQAAEQRIVELTKAFEKFRDVVRGCERLASKYSPSIDAVDEGGGDDNDDPTLAIFHRLYYAMFDADAALNHKPEAGSHEMAREALKMENQRIVPARFKCLACGEYHEGSGNLPCPKMLATSVTLKTGAYKKRED